MTRNGKPNVQDPVLNASIVDVRPMTDAEMMREGWEDDFHGRPIALVLSSGTVLYPSRDEEGNGGGAMFGYGRDGVAFLVVGNR